MKPPDRPASEAQKEEVLIYESIGWIDMMSNVERGLWDCLRGLNFSEREGLLAGIANGYSEVTGA
ncbi:MAG: hypothetical protein ABSD38_39085, partial [Syntrophorhabdales bacterium]